MKNTLIAIIVIIAVAVAGYLFYRNGEYVDDNGTSTTTDNSGTEGAPALVRAGGNAIYVSDQRPGASFKANFVQLEKPGYVVIHASTNGQPGDIVGHSEILTAGSHTNVPVVLTKQFAPGTRLLAMVHTDNGDDMWVSAQDTQVAGLSGNPVMIEFMIDATAPAENPPVQL